MTSSSIEEEPETIAPLKEDSLERQVQQVQGAACSSKFSNSDRKSLKSGNGSGGTRRSSSTIPPPLTNLPVNSQSLGSNYASATSGSSNSGTGGKKSLHSGGSMDSSTARDFSGLTKQMNMFLRTRSDSGKKLNDEVIYDIIHSLLFENQSKTNPREASFFYNIQKKKKSPFLTFTHFLARILFLNQ